MTVMEIIDFEPQFAEAFRTLNEAWITRYFTLEDKDRQILGDPVGQIIARGGSILFAVEGQTPVGCVALIPMADGGAELAKMAVDPASHGRGCAKALMSACVARARETGAHRLYLETHSSLAPAIGLYRATGFTDVPADCAPPSPYARCDVRMELAL